MYTLIGFNVMPDLHPIVSCLAFRPAFNLCFCAPLAGATYPWGARFLRWLFALVINVRLLAPHQESPRSASFPV